MNDADDIDDLIMLRALEFEATMTRIEFLDSLDHESKIISIESGSPARKMYEAKMALIKFVYRKAESEQ